MATVPDENGKEAKKLTEFHFATTDAKYMFNYPLVCVHEPDTKYRIVNLLEQG